MYCDIEKAVLLIIFKELHLITALHASFCHHPEKEVFVEIVVQIRLTEIACDPQCFAFLIDMVINLQCTDLFWYEIPFHSIVLFQATRPIYRSQTIQTLDTVSYTHLTLPTNREV